MIPTLALAIPYLKKYLPEIIGAVFLVGAYLLGHHQGAGAVQAKWDYAIHQEEVAQAKARSVVERDAAQSVATIDSLNTNLKAKQDALEKLAVASDGAAASGPPVAEKPDVVCMRGTLPADIVRGIDAIR